MSNAVFAGDTSGSITIQAPAVAGTNTLTLPAKTGTILTDATPGTVLQVVVGSMSTSFSTTSSTYADIGLSATITPKFTSSKILVMVNASGCYKDTNNTWLWAKVQKNNADWKNLTMFSAYTGNTNPIAIGSCCGEWLDSPATTSAITYKVQAASAQNNANIYVNNGGDGSSIILMEISA